MRELIRLAGVRKRIHNNCSGKRTGMLAAPSISASIRAVMSNPTIATGMIGNFRELRICVDQAA